MLTTSRAIRVFSLFGLIGVLTAPAVASVLTLTDVTIGSFNTPIGIDYHEPTDSVVMSVNHSSGLPHNFECVDAFGTVT